MKKPSDIYPLAWYQEGYNAEQQGEIERAADVLMDVFKPQTALDVGCGPGMLVRQLRWHGVDAIGFDGSEHALTHAHPSVKPYIWIYDITQGPKLPTRAQLVVCTEVAEHIEFMHADKLVDFLADSAREWVVFTAAPPGQGGHDHCNERPMHYWIEKFCARGFDVEETLTAAVKEGWLPLTRMWFYAANVRVFKRVGA